MLCFEKEIKKYLLYLKKKLLWQNFVENLKYRPSELKFLLYFKKYQTKYVFDPYKTVTFFFFLTS